ncbi:GGDEF domain-containing protein [Mangrovimicrobium sediminis]|uniref:diguanylate cyclase n=1 Tax=Mangrovimicrobium sediminis TaxID=2562682 RepID=A0A4Z0M3D2_9GAMM|nr:GGDEF domain-containing protein [Haliea sp. SAOS-164]TGD74122.1 GGDEF domain-containing protein [Haliea sp. SAOS-164]
MLLGSALWARPQVGSLPHDWRQLLELLPYLLAGINVVVAHQFGRVRLLLAALGLAALYWLVRTYLQVSLDDATTARIYLGASFAVPVTAGFLLLVPEAGVFSRAGSLQAIAAAILVAMCFALSTLLLSRYGNANVYISAYPVENYVASPVATALVLAVCLLGLGLLLRHARDADAALTLAALCAHAGLAWLALDNVSVVTAVAGQLCLGWGLLRSSHAMAYRDELTGLLGRRALNERLRSLGRHYSIAMLDIDHFKRFNDTHGHEVGDDVLRFVASRLQRVGHGGTAYRYGGEEFCIVFPRRGVEECAAVLDDLREQIAEYRLSLRDRRRRPPKPREGTRRRGATRLRPDQVSVTISVGVAARSEEYGDAPAVLEAADAQLYRAKRGGRNRVAC